MNPRAKTDTRERILEAAEGLVTSKGLTATSVEKIIDAVGITKGAFFYHFKSKAEMARALIARNADLDIERLDTFSARARELSTDPLQSLLVFLGLYIELMEHIDEGVPGCLFVAFSTESGQFDPEILEQLDRVVVVWREKLAAWLLEAAEAHPPVRDFDADSLADMLTVVFEGSYVVARMTQDPVIFAQQLRHYRSYVELLFAGP